MTSLIVNIVYTLFGGGIAEKVSKWMDNIWQALEIIFNGNNLVEAGMKAFAGVCASLMILYFLMDLASQASKDLLTLEKLTTMCIKCVIATVILLNSTVLMNGIMEVGKEVYHKATTVTLVSSMTLKDEEGHAYEDYSEHSWASVKGKSHTEDGNTTDDDKKAAIKDKLDEEYDSFWKGLKKIWGFLASGLVAWLVAFACQVICFLKCTTNALQICVRGFMAPLALPQLFDEGQRSSAIRYFKAFAAECLEMALIIVVLKLAAELSTALQPAVFGMYNSGGYLFVGGEIVPANLEKALAIDGIIPTLIPHLAAAGAVSGVSKICHDIVG